MHGITPHLSWHHTTPHLTSPAQVRALSDVALLSLDRQHFNTLMGPLLTKMSREAENYMRGAWKAHKKVGSRLIRLACF